MEDIVLALFTGLFIGSIIGLPVAFWLYVLVDKWLDHRSIVKSFDAFAKKLGKEGQPDEGPITFYTTTMKK